jgi:hypothetical protein
LESLSLAADNLPDIYDELVLRLFTTLSNRLLPLLQLLLLPLLPLRLLLRQGLGTLCQPPG